MAGPSEPCVTCGEPHGGRYCPACGEKRLDDHDLSLRHFASHAVEAFVHADGRILRSLRALFLSPGLLTADYLRGKRKPYLAPLSLFLVVNLGYFLIQPLARWDTLVTPLESHLSTQVYASWVKPLVDRRLARTGETFAAYAEKFDHNVGVEAHALTLALALLFSVPVTILLFPRRKRLLDHLVFSLHFCAFLLLWLFTAEVLFNQLVRLTEALTPLRWSGSAMDLVVSTCLLLGCGLYLRAALRRTYGGRGPALLAKATLLSLALIPVTWAYRLVLFFVAFYRA
jgi:hypothetical protein